MLRDLFRSWWSADRIRASAAEGRLLRLTPPCVTLIDGEQVEVHSREDRSTEESARVIYPCTVNDEARQLEVWTDERRRLRYRWMDSNNAT